MESIQNFINATINQPSDLTYLRLIVMYNIKQKFKEIKYEENKKLQSIEFFLSDFEIKFPKHAKKLLLKIIDKNSFSYSSGTQSIKINFPPRFIYSKMIQKSYEQLIQDGICHQQALTLYRTTENRDALIKSLFKMAIQKSTHVEFQKGFQSFWLASFHGSFVSIPKFITNKKQFQKDYSLLQSVKPQFIKLVDQMKEYPNINSVFLEPVYLQTQTNQLIKDPRSKSIDMIILKVVTEKQSSNLSINMLDIIVSNSEQYIRDKFRRFIENFNQFKDKDQKFIYHNKKSYRVEYNCYVVKPKATEEKQILNFLRKNTEFNFKKLSKVCEIYQNIQQTPSNNGTIKNFGVLLFQNTIFKN